MRYLLLAGLTACFAATGADGTDRAASIDQSATPSGAVRPSDVRATSRQSATRDGVGPASKDTVDSLQAVRRATVLDTLGKARAAVAPKAGGGCPHTTTQGAERSRLFTRTICHPAFRDAGSALDWPRSDVSTNAD